MHRQSKCIQLLASNIRNNGVIQLVKYYFDNVLSYIQNWVTYVLNRSQFTNKSLQDNICNASRSNYGMFVYSPLRQMHFGRKILIKCMSWHSSWFDQTYVMVFIMRSSSWWLYSQTIKVIALSWLATSVNPTNLISVSPRERLWHEQVFHKETHFYWGRNYM